MFIPIILGTAREGRHSEKVALYVNSILEMHSDIETEVVDVRDHHFGVTIPAWVSDDRTAKWKELALRADGYILVVPEYNHSYPGELKILLDSALKEYKGKPFGVCGVSNGNFGGVRMVEQLHLVVLAIGGIVVKPSYFSKVEEFDADEAKKEENISYKQVATTIDQLIAYIQRVV